MRIRWLILVGLVTMLGCKDKLEWTEHKIRAFEMGGFKFTIPPGWRDLSESKDPTLAHMARRLGPDTDARLIVRANDTNTDSNIAFMFTDLTGTPTCEQWVTAMESQPGALIIDHTSIVTEQFADDAGCSFRMTEGSTSGRIVLRFRSPKFLTIQCMRPTKGDSNLDATCDSVVGFLRAQR